MLIRFLIVVLLLFNALITHPENIINSSIVTESASTFSCEGMKVFDAVDKITEEYGQISVEVEYEDGSKLTMEELKRARVKYDLGIQDDCRYKVIVEIPSEDSY